MAGFVGTYPCKLDERGRFILPAKLREKMPGTIHITRSLVDNCLILYTEEEWKVLEEQVRDLPTTTNRAAKNFVQVVFGQAAECELDKQGRMCLTPLLLKAAKLDKDIVLVGVGAKMEIWDAQQYEANMAELDFGEILDGISQFGLNI